MRFNRQGLGGPTPLAFSQANMQRFQSPSLFLTVALLAGSAVAQESTLWISDDTINTVFEVTEAGAILRSWPSSAISGLAVDPNDETLWAALEGFDRIRNYDKDGMTLGTFLASEIYEAELGTPVDPLLTRPEGVAVDYSDGSLWLVDDDLNRAINFTTDGTTSGGFLVPTVISSFMTPFGASLQGIASDPDGTLWFTDNVHESVFNVSDTGEVLSEFSTELFTGSMVWSENNSQGISVSEVDGTLWVTDRFQQTVYHVTRTGATISSFPATAFSTSTTNATNLTGVAFDLCEGGAGINFASATGFAALVYSSLNLFHNDTLIEGKVGLGANGYQNFQGGAIDGDYVRDPGAFVPNYDNTDRLSGTDTIEDLDSVFIDGLEASYDMHDLVADQTFGWILDDFTITGGTGLNVVDTHGLWLWNDALTLSGNPCSTFVINIHGALRMYAGSQIILEGGVLPENVYFNVSHCGWSVRIKHESTVNGSIIAPFRNIWAGNESTVNGSIYTCDHAVVWDGAEIKGN